MARRDYICCKSCDCKLIYDGYDYARDALNAQYGTRELICPSCLDELEVRLTELEQAPAVEPAHDEVPMPQNADQAQAMALLAENWLKHNAPDRLKEPAQEAPVAWMVTRAMAEPTLEWAKPKKHSCLRYEPLYTHPAPLESKQAVPVAGIDQIEQLAQQAYLEYINQLKQDICLGVEYKMEQGTFGKAELTAHKNAQLWLGKHKAFREVVILLKRMEIDQ